MGLWPSPLCPSPAGPLPAPLLVLCPSQAELGHWLYHLEKQIALVGGVPRCPPEPLQVSAGNPAPLSLPLLHLPLTLSSQGPTEDALPCTLQHRLTRLRTASGRQVMGSAICASRVKLQHLPSQVGAQRWEEVGAGYGLQVGPGPGCMPAETPLHPVTSLQEQCDRLLVLYPTSLAIFSEEADGLCFKVGPSPLQTRPREAPCTWGWEGATAQEEPVCRGLLGQVAPPTQPAVLVSLVSAYHGQGRWAPCLSTLYHASKSTATSRPVTWGWHGAHSAPGRCLYL